MESDNLEEPLVFNYAIASSYLCDLFLFFFFCRKRALMLSTFKLCRGDLKRCASESLKISARGLYAKAKLSFPLFALKKGKIIRQKFVNFFSADKCKPSTKVEECQIIR